MKTDRDELREEYPKDLIRSGERGKHSELFREGVKLVAIALDLQEYFPDSAAVDKALREYLAAQR